MKSSGLLATFNSQDNFVRALKSLRHQGYRHLDTATSQEIEGLDEILGHTPRAPLYSRTGLAGAVFGLSVGFLMQWYASVEQTPLNVGGRPLNSWPSFIPVTYILMILCSALFLTATFFIDLRLPWPSHALFETSLDLSLDNFSIIIKNEDPFFETSKTSDLLHQLKADRIEEIP